MRRVRDIGRRIELVSMDLHFHDITIALYRQEHNRKPIFRVHTYSNLDGATARIHGVSLAMKTLGGMLKTPDGALYFPCGTAHEAACRRVFLEACKLSPESAPAESRPLHTLDKKLRMTVTAHSSGSGSYRVTAASETPNAKRRISAIANGLMKLGEMERVGESYDTVTFPCEHAHDALVGLLLVRAPNVRVVRREEEMGGKRGVLSAPGQQL